MDTTARLNNPVLHYGILFLIYGVGVITLLSHAILHNSHGHLAVSSVSAAAVAPCSQGGAAHVVEIQNNQASPLTTDAKLCDTVKFVNVGKATREIAFGPHEDHVPYDGVAERVLGPNKSFTIRLNQVGLFHYHDHAHDEVAGYFNVSN